MRHWTRRGILGSSLALAACAAFDRPQLGQLYAGTARPRDQPPLILIPGAFGSSLRDRRSGRELWPVSDSRLLLGNYRELELPIDPAALPGEPGSAEAYAVFREGLGRDFYGQLLQTLQRAGGYRRCRAGRPPAGDGACSLYTYVYDFRLDNVRAAAGLGALIEQVRADFGDPRLTVDVVAHSNGGLLARYFIRHGAPYGALASPDEAARAVRRLMLVGTPNMGTLQPVLSLLRGEEIGLRRIPPEVIATGPGIPQTMPHPTVDWLVDLQGRPLRADLYDVATWRDFGWSVFDEQIAGRVIELHGGGAAGRRYLAVLREYLALSLQGGRRFAESFATGPDPASVPTWVFGGDCEPTLARLVGESVGGRLMPRERVVDIAMPLPGVDYQAVMHEPGDTVVTRASLLGRRDNQVAGPPTAQESLRAGAAVFFCEHHQQLTGNPVLQDNLLHALFRADPA